VLKAEAKNVMMGSHMQRFFRPWIASSMQHCADRYHPVAQNRFTKAAPSTWPAPRKPMFSFVRLLDKVATAPPLPVRNW